MDQFDPVLDNELEELDAEKRIQMEGVRFLEMSSLPSTTMVPMNHSLPRALSRMCDAKFKCIEIVPHDY